MAPLSVAETPPPPVSRLWALLVVVTVSLGFSMAILDVTIVNVAIADIQENFDARLSVLVWVIDAYTLTFAALLLLGGALADRWGAKRIYIAGLAWFIVASALCSVATSGPFLVGARLLQGVGAALFMPSSLNLLTESFPDRMRRTKLLGLWSAIVGIAAGAGPLVGGILIYFWGWRSVFYLNIPIGILGVIMAAILLRPSPRISRPLDLRSHALIVVSLAGLSFVLIDGPRFGWLSPSITIAAALAVIGSLLVVWREARGASPIIPPALVRIRRFWALNAVGFLVNFVLFGEIFLISMFLQEARGTSALETGLDMLPIMGVLSMMNLSSGYLANRWGGRRVLVAGFACAATGAAVTTLLGGGVSYWILVVPIAFCNAGIGLAVPAMMTGVMQQAGPHAGNVGAATLNANRQIGALTGVAGVGIVVHQVDTWTSTLRLIFGLSTVCMVIAIALAASGEDRVP